MLDIKTNRLVLRAIQTEDAAEIVELLDDPVLKRWTQTLPSPYTLEHAVRWISKPRDQLHDDLAISDAVSSQFFGCVGFRVDEKNKSADIGFWIGRKFWNTGICTEAVAGLIQYLFRDRFLHRIAARSVSENSAACRVLEKNHFTREGVMRDCLLKSGDFFSLVLYSILSTERS